MDRIAVFPGSFDPITRGHESIVLRSLPLFSKIVVAVGVNAGKQGLYPLELRMDWIRNVFAGLEKVEVASFSGLTVDFCKQTGAGFILRGLRSSLDFGFEQGIGQMNRIMEPEIETVFLLSLPEYNALSSSIVRDIIRHGGDVSRFVPDKLPVEQLSKS